MLVPSEEDEFVSAPGRPLGLKVQKIEAAVFLFLVVPSMIFSFYSSRQAGLSFALMASGTILRDLALVSLIFYFLWRNAEPVDWIGWRFDRFGREAALGVALFIPFFFGAALLGSALQEAGLSAPSTPPTAFLPERTAGQMLLALALVIVVAVAEETIFRGYLLLRFTAITRNPTVSLFLSSAIFALGHGYQGTAGVVTVGVMGFVFGLVYFWRRSLVAPMVMHFLQDLTAIFLLLFFDLK
ncbi:CPBP family intramembrane glutamic endopeptidase [Candidatus Manganitrophus noduliformans]|uniref:CPBP family intramembrane metalloprotease n=1 Tax=Candidatus Manganitrophus noduliformans TaxID=2606439 RepID=A0A7X6IA33_9BACT|nr:type II CAAX endopeptidase family protein [Candidatus Manganitrophus noduliformans]NKE70071.1 CPBP family intramembrane metalloprotease [Candidatus Manganitrophus noduliformans]